MQTGFSSRRRMAAAVLLLGGLFAGTAQAQSCPSTLPTIVLGATTAGASYVKNIRLTSQSPNPSGTVSLCRYTGTKYVTPTGGSEFADGSFSVDRISAASGVSDPANAWVVRLFDLDGKYECNGSVIAPDWILTAGHCTGGSPAVAVGGLVTGGVATWMMRQCLYLPKRTCFDFPNPNLQLSYVSRVYKSTSADVALLRLTTPMVLTRYGQHGLAKSYPGGDRAGTLLTWMCNDAAATKATCPNGADALASYRVTFWRDDDCSAVYDYENQFCSTGRTMIKGDSGGPLVYDNLVVGVLSARGGPVGVRAIFADITQQSVWIGKTTNYVQVPGRL
jgi:hypothetical protein